MKYVGLRWIIARFARLSAKLKFETTKPIHKLVYHFDEKSLGDGLSVTVEKWGLKRQLFLLERQRPGAEVVQDELCILEAAEAQCT